MEDVDLFWLAGSLHGRMPLLQPHVRAAVDLALVGLAWKAFIRDAGPGDTGPLFSGWRHADHALLTEDPRAGAVLAWLAARAGPLKAAAARMHRARGSSGIRFSADERAMLDDAVDALCAAGVSLNAAPPIVNLLSAISALRANARFASAPPARSAEVGGAWAINLALASLPTPAPQPGIVTRAALRVDLSLDREELLRSWGAAATLVYGRVRQVADRLRDVSPMVDSFSSSARIKGIIGAMAALETMRRPQIKRGWELSEAGTTLIMRQLTDAGIARSDGRGELVWAYAPAQSAVVGDYALVESAAIAEFDGAMAFANSVLNEDRQR